MGWSRRFFFLVSHDDDNNDIHDLAVFIYRILSRLGSSVENMEQASESVLLIRRVGKRRQRLSNINIG